MTPSKPGTRFLWIFLQVLAARTPSTLLDWVTMASLSAWWCRGLKRTTQQFCEFISVSCISSFVFYIFVTLVPFAMWSWLYSSPRGVLCLFPGVLWLWHFLYSVGPHTVSRLHIYTFVLSRALMAGAASEAGDADSSRAPGLTSGLQGSVNVHRGALLLVPQWQCISSFVFYIFVTLVCSLCHVELVVQFPARGSTPVLLCLFPGVLWLWHFLYRVGPHKVSCLHIFTFVLSWAFMAGADSSRAPGLTSGLQGSVNVHRGALLLVPQWQCISSFVFYTYIWIFTLHSRKYLTQYLAFDSCLER